MGPLGALLVVVCVHSCSSRHMCLLLQIRNIINLKLNNWNTSGASDLADIVEIYDMSAL